MHAQNVRSLEPGDLALHLLLHLEVRPILCRDSPPSLHQGLLHLLAGYPRTRHANCFLAGHWARIMALREQNPKTATNITPKLRQFIGSQSKERLDAHDIANRLMRKE